MEIKTLSSVSIDCVIFGFDEGELKVLLVKRSSKVLNGKRHLPGGFCWNRGRS